MTDLVVFLICLRLTSVSGDAVEHDTKPSKKVLPLLGGRKDKKDKKDRGYATLDGESSPDEEPEVK